MTKTKDLPTTLSAFIESRRYEPFSWGKNDCALFCADAVYTLTGVDYAQNWRGRYASVLECSRVLHKSGTSLEAVVTSCLGEPVSAAYLRRGDIGLFNNGDGDTLGVCVGMVLASPGPGGLVFTDMKHCLKGWHLCPR